MGQKVNPISLRLGKTNKNYNSLWYGELAYGEFLKEEIISKTYIKKLLTQIGETPGDIGLLLHPKKGKILSPYLWVEGRRRVRSNRFQLKHITERYFPHPSLLKTGKVKPFLLLGELDKIGAPSLVFREKVEGAGRGSPSSPLAVTDSPRHSNLFWKGFILRLSLLSLQGRGGWWGTLVTCTAPTHTLTDTPLQLGWTSPHPPWRDCNIFHPSYIFDVTEKPPGKEDVKLSMRDILNNGVFVDPLFLYDVGASLWERGYIFNVREGENQGLNSLQNFQPLSSYTEDVTETGKIESEFVQIPAARKPSDTRLRNIKNVTEKELLSLSEGRFHLAYNGNAVTSSMSPAREIGSPVSSAGRIGKNIEKRGASHQTFSLREKEEQPPVLFISHLESFCEKICGTPFNIHLWRSFWDGGSATFLAKEITYFLQKRVPFPKIRREISREISENQGRVWNSIEGIRISCSGRSGGKSKKAQRGKSETFYWGRNSSSLFLSRVGFGKSTALTQLGAVGVKVWICYKSETGVGNF